MLRKTCVKTCVFVFCFVELLQSSVCCRLTTRSRRHVVDDVSVDQVIKNQEQQQQQAAVTTTTTTTKLTDCFMSFTQQERVSSTTRCHVTAIQIYVVCYEE